MVDDLTGIFDSANVMRQPVMAVQESMPQAGNFPSQFPQATSNFEPVMVAENPAADMMQQYGPQRIGDNSYRYEDNDFFNELVNTPAILRGKRQEDLDVQQSRQSFDLDNDMSDFFKDIPD